MSDGEDQHDIVLLLVAVQGKMAGSATRDDELPQVVLDWSADEGVIPENLHRLRYQVDSLERRKC